jgi:hypothetical protein
MDKVIIIFLLLVTFAAGWIGATLNASKKTSQVVAAMSMLELSKVENRAREAYTNESVSIAIWELNHFKAALESSLRDKPQGPKSLNMQLFLVHARLARLHHLDKNEIDTQKDFQQATNFYNPGRIVAGYPDSQITDFKTLLERLEKFDQIDHLQRKDK